MPLQVALENWGLIDYKQAWDRQEDLFKAKTELKLANRINASQSPVPNHFVLCEHPHVYTLGKSGKPDHLLLTEAQLPDIGASYYAINRGGDITYHGPGQVVGYPIFDLEQFFTDIHRYLRTLEEAIILTLAEYGIRGERYEGYTGVWLDAADSHRARKICAMGVRCSRWITMHGFAFNVNTDLSYFNHIVPCGIDDKQVTSMQHELGYTVDMQEVQHRLLGNLARLFDVQWINQ